jgi:DNA gyrase subunit A
MGRSARGVRGISLREGDGGRDRVVGAVVVDDAKHLVTITEGGFGKRSPFDDFRTMANRGGFGVRTHNITEKTGLLSGIAAVDGDQDLMMITDQGTIIRTPASDISILSRSAAGVIVMRLPEGQYVANFTVVAKEEAKEEEEADIAEGEVDASDADAVEADDIEVIEIPDETNED